MRKRAYISVSLFRHAVLIMRKRDALRLKRGDRIVFGESMWSDVNYP
jgi:hypothetical protein